MLITRPEPQASRMACELKAKGVRVVVSPLMRTVHLPVHLPGGIFATTILTSEAGALAAGQLLGRVPDHALCVGGRTASVARAAGFTAREAGANAEDLLAALATEPGPFLYLRGREAATDIAARLTARGQAAASVVIYAQEPAPLTPRALALLAAPGPVVVPLYSARSARLFLAACPPDAAATLYPAVIAAPVADGLPPALRSRAQVAETPDGAAMQTAILGLLRTVAA